MRLPATLFALLLTTAAASAETPEQSKGAMLPMPMVASWTTPITVEVG